MENTNNNTALYILSVDYENNAPLFWQTEGAAIYEAGAALARALNCPVETDADRVQRYALPLDLGRAVETLLESCRDWTPAPYCDHAPHPILIEARAASELSDIFPDAEPSEDAEPQTDAETSGEQEQEPQTEPPRAFERDFYAAIEQEDADAQAQLRADFDALSLEGRRAAYLFLTEGALTIETSLANALAVERQNALDKFNALTKEGKSAEDAFKVICTPDCDKDEELKERYCDAVNEYLDINEIGEEDAEAATEALGFRFWALTSLERRAALDLTEEGYADLDESIDRARELDDLTDEAIDFYESIKADGATDEAIENAVDFDALESDEKELVKTLVEEGVDAEDAIRHASRGDYWKMVDASERGDINAALADAYIESMGGIDQLDRDTIERYFDYADFGRDLRFDLDLIETESGDIYLR